MIDTHAHLTSPELRNDLDAILERARAAGITKIVNICVDVPCLERGLALHEKEPWVVNAGATLPHNVEQEGERDFDFFSAAARTAQLIAIGETGLDYHYAHSPREQQQEFLERYLSLAQECSLPVIFHCRDAFSDLFQISKRTPPKAAVLHCFTGTLDEAKECVERGWLISLSGILTFKKSEELRHVARHIPLDHIVLETDTPFLAPQKYRGKTNEPAFIVETASCLAAIKQLPLEEVIRVTSENANRFFSFE